jgi:hypothetical protein
MEEKFKILIHRNAAMIGLLCRSTMFMATGEYGQDLLPDSGLCNFIGASSLALHKP